MDAMCSDWGTILREHPVILVVVPGGIVEVPCTVVVVMPGSVDVVVEEGMAEVVVVGDVDDEVVESYSQLLQGSKTFITIISANGQELGNGP